MRLSNECRIRLFRSWRFVEEQVVHNVWTTVGRQYLAEIITLSIFSPPVYERDDRLKYFALGMGSTKGGVSSDPQVSATYPAGYDPSATAGNEYNSAYPVVPPITTLELPVKKTGSTTSYPGSVSDIWMWGPSDGVYFTHKDNISVTMHAVIDTSGGDITGIWSPAEQVDITEAAMLLSSASIYTVYEPVVAYISFDKLELDDDTQLEFIWDVRFLA